jgi:hypothetical protein
MNNNMRRMKTNSYSLSIGGVLLVFVCLALAHGQNVTNTNPPVTPAKAQVAGTPNSFANAVEKDARVQSNGAPWRFAKAPVLDPKLPRVLLVGDSILNGYLPHAVKLLDGKANVDAWVNPYHQSEDFTRRLALALESGPYDVVHLNTGLHGWQPGRIKAGTFEPLTRSLIEVIRQKCPNAKIVWASSTPILLKGERKLDPELDPIIVEQNRLAAKVMAELKVPVNDLYALTVTQLDLARGDQFHWTTPGSKLMADAVVAAISNVLSAKPEYSASVNQRSASGFTDAAAFGFAVESSGVENAKALQRAVDQGGTIVVSRPGIYQMARTIYVGSDTSLVFGHGVFLKKVAEEGPFSHVLLNKGALTKTYDRNISVEGLQIIVNGVDVRTFKDVFGLHGQVAFFYVKDLRIARFRCPDLGKIQYGIHVCTFEDLLIDDVIIRGEKDGVHLGTGKRFTIRNGVFQTFDDAVALNAHDYDVGNPELGWIEDGVVENCHDLNAANTTGYFCRILAGAWIDWRAGMKVQKSDTVVSDGRLYRVRANPDGKIYESTTQPTHGSGAMTLDGITWVMVQTNVTYTAGVRNVTFRDIFLGKPRTAFSIHFDNDKFSRSYYPGAKIPQQQQLVFDNIRVLHDQRKDFLSVGTPVDVVTIVNSSFRNNRIFFRGNQALPDYLPTQINLLGCVFNYAGAMELVVNSIPGKEARLKTTGSVEMQKDFSAVVSPGAGEISVDSDLTGLKKPRE